jgi:hypothetical protein
MNICLFIHKQAEASIASVHGRHCSETTGDVFTKYSVSDRSHCKIWTVSNVFRYILLIGISNLFFSTSVGAVSTYICEQERVPGVPVFDHFCEGLSTDTAMLAHGVVFDLPNVRALPISSFTEFEEKRQTDPLAYSARAFAIAEKIWHLDSTLGLTKTELIKACLFIENKACRRHGVIQYSKKEHGLPCTIIKIPSLKGYIISNVPKGYIGRGAHKTVRKVVLYSDSPRIIASCLCDGSGKSEVRILKKLRGCRGIVSLLGGIRHSYGKLEFLLEYFPEGSLLCKRIHKYAFTQDQELKIAKDVSHGLLAMHRKHLIHRDLHSGNILLRNGSGGLFDAVLVDFGKTMHISKATNKDVPQAAKSKNPPEMLIHSIDTLNRYAVDVYALGSNLYSLFWSESLPWAYAFNPYLLRSKSYKERRKIYRKIVTEYESLKKERTHLLKNASSLTAYQQVQLLIFSMIDYRPSRRPSMAEVVKKLDELVP